MTTLAPRPAEAANDRDVGRAGSLSAAARARLGRDGGPIFRTDWEDVLMIHYEVDPAALAPFVPFPLDLHEGRAFVSLVAFHMRGTRFTRGGPFGRALGALFADHGFLNVRTYVTVAGEPGIYFLTEHVDHLLSLKLGPALFGLPYRLARLAYRHDWRTGRVEGRVSDPRTGTALSYRALVAADATDYRAPAAGSLTEWLMERYTAYTERAGTRRRFHVWHEPWPAAPAAFRLGDDSLLRERWPWFAGARLVGADFSPGAKDVRMGRPKKL
jgi:uncharacterized protein YqjF (DUF2071 family)